MLEYDKVVALVLKEIYQSDNVRVLAHLQYVDLSAGLIDFDNFHVSFPGSLQGHSLTGLYMGALKDLAKLALTDGLAIEGEEVLDLR